MLPSCQPSSPAATWKDVRMRGFQDRTEVSEVLALLDRRLSALDAETVPLAEAAGRVLANDIEAETAVPNFARAAMDGYALRGDETFGAGSYSPLDFVVIGEAYPGRPYPGTVQVGQAVRIMTGAPLPAGADAVMQVEATEEINGGVRVSESVSPGRHVGKRGEDIEPGTIVLRARRVLRPQDLGVLASLGVTPVRVVRQPKVSILVTGNELLPAGSKPEGFCIVDSNSVMLAALVKRDGGLAEAAVLIPDTKEAVWAAVQAAAGDVLLISGGSSVGNEDHAPQVLAEYGELCVHGVALRPASPTGIGFLDKRPVFLLPGNPVSCLCAYDLFASRGVRLLGGRSGEISYRSGRLPLARKISSPVGRVDYVRVHVRDGLVEPLATSGASILSSTTRADGFLLVPSDSEGFAEGETITLYFYDA